MKRYTAGGEATLLRLEILNVDAFVLITEGAGPEAPLQARRNGSSGVREGPHSHRMARRGTWEVPHCPRMMAGARRHHAGFIDRNEYGRNLETMARSARSFSDWNADFFRVGTLIVSLRIMQ